MNKKRDRIVVSDNICGCNEIAFLRQSGLDQDDLVYLSFKDGIRVCPYGIVIDRERRAVVVTIRGTFSLESTVTDLNVRPALLDDYKDKCSGLDGSTMAGEYCHVGMLESALWVYEDLGRHKILDKLLLGEKASCSGFQLVFLGHSLGAGVAAVLSLMQKPNFHNLQCLCFSPPGCVLSKRASEQDYITSYVLDADIVPRLSLHSVNDLRSDVLDMVCSWMMSCHFYGSSTDDR
jgi:sn1-specific diacylglycerol lipase